MRIYWLVALICLLNTWERVHTDLIEVDFIPDILLSDLAYNKTLFTKERAAYLVYTGCQP